MTASSTSFPHLMAPIRVGRQTLPNRVIMGSMHTNLEEMGEEGLKRLAAFYAERARGGCCLIVTGGFSPNAEGRMGREGGFVVAEDRQRHRVITDAVHGAGGRILLQLLHAGRYGYHSDIVAPSPIQAPINKASPREMSEDDIRRTIADFAQAADIAKAAGYDGVEIMGSEGYLLNEFTAPRTNKRTDQWGGAFENRIRLPVEVVRAVRAATGPEFIVMYRISVLDVVEDGSPFEEVVALAKACVAAGADVLNSGVGWHEAPIPTITQAVPRAGWVWATARLMKEEVGVPLIATNRINTPEVAEAIVAGGEADLISMARPFLADADFMAKTAAGRPERINTCIACNQACLDNYFTGREATCLVNPRAGRETLLDWGPTGTPKRVAVVGAGVAGLAAATVAAERGHHVTVFEAEGQVGGQFLYARAIPGKQEFNETLRYFTTRLGELGVTVKTSMRASLQDLAGFDEVVIATGVKPRLPDIAGVDHAKVATYQDVLSGKVVPGRRVAVMGAGGIGVDVAAFLVERGHRSHLETEPFRDTWGIDRAAKAAPPSHEVVLLQRSDKRMGSGPGKTTGWVHRAILQRAKVEMIPSVTYERIDDEGLHIQAGGAARTIVCDTIVLCTGQEFASTLCDDLAKAGRTAHVIGGARLAAELDAQRAIEEGTRVAATL